MADLLTPKQRSAFNRAIKHPELLPILFRKVKDLYWFDVFQEEGLLEPSLNPHPKETDKGYFQIPLWPITEYLVQSSFQLKKSANKDYAIQYRDFLKDVTGYAIREKYGNYQTWWRFAQIIRNVPIDFLKLEHLEMIQYWVSDIFDRGICGEALGKWLLDLLEIDSNHSKQLALKLLDILYETSLGEERYGKSQSVLSIDSYHIKQISENSAFISGTVLGQAVVELFRNKLEDVVEQQGNDQWSSIWRPAIEEHKQNIRDDDADDIILMFFRDALSGFVEIEQGNTEKYLIELLESKYQIIHRIVIYVVSEKFSTVSVELFTKIVQQNFFNDSNYRHELWHFFSKRFNEFSKEQQDVILNCIDEIEETDEDGNISKKSTYYQKSIWLSAISDKNELISELYNKCLKITGTEPEHPDFSSYMSSAWVVHESPIALEELRTLNYGELVGVLNEYQGTTQFREPGVEGLTKGFREIVKLDAEKIYLELDIFINLDIPYIYSLTEAFLELWNNEKDNPLPWDSIWPKLLDCIYKIIQKDSFWQWPEERQDGAFVANHLWVVGSIGRLIESGCKKNEHSFSVENISLSHSILEFLLQNVTGESFHHDSDAVSIAINSPRGRCLEGLINLTLFTCRNSESIGLTHEGAWLKYKEIYDNELHKPDENEYEFATLVANYLLNFTYLSKEWVIQNLPIIFEQKNYQRWLCAMQGYSYVNQLHPDVYDYLAKNGNFMKALDDDNLKKRVEDRYVQFITLAFINGKEDLDDPHSQMSLLIQRTEHNELRQLIWFLWTFRKNITDLIRNKVYQLWSKLMKTLDENTKQGKSLASQLCHFSAFVDVIDDERKNWLLRISLYSDVDHNSYDLLENLSKLSNNQPFDVKDIWLEMLTNYSYDYPDEAIKKILQNLVAQEESGIRAAKEITSAYLKHGLTRPNEWLEEIMNDKKFY